MALSEQEQRVLDEIESALYREDPQFGRSVGTGSVPGVTLKTTALGLLGLCALIAGVALSQLSLWFIALGALGFLLMFGAGFWALRGSGEKNPKNRTGNKRMNTGRGSSKVDDIEASFRRRFE